MLSLLLSTLEMMFLTFAIGFFVAGIIKGIAFWADSLDFFSSHQEELKRLKRMRRIRRRTFKLLGIIPSENEESQEPEIEKFYRGENDDFQDDKPQGYYHGVSHGSAELDLMDYYYPNVSKIKILEKQIQDMKEGNENNENSLKK